MQPLLQLGVLVLGLVPLGLLPLSAFELPLSVHLLAEVGVLIAIKSGVSQDHDQLLHLLDGGPITDDLGAFLVGAIAKHLDDAIRLPRGLSLRLPEDRGREEFHALVVLRRGAMGPRVPVGLVRDVLVEVRAHSGLKRSRASINTSYTERESIVRQ